MRPVVAVAGHSSSSGNSSGRPGCTNRRALIFAVAAVICALVALVAAAAAATVMVVAAWACQELNALPPSPTAMAAAITTTASIPAAHASGVPIFLLILFN